MRGLTLGGDDYMQKPFSLEELVARATAVLRRTGATKQSGTVLTCEDLVLDDDAHRVTRGADVEVSLSPTEYNLLRFLLVNQGRVLSKAQILDHVWHYDFGGDGGVVETYIGYLRRKVDAGDRKLTHHRPRHRLRPAPAGDYEAVRALAADAPARRHGVVVGGARRGRPARDHDHQRSPDRPGRRPPRAADRISAGAPGGTERRPAARATASRSSTSTSTATGRWAYLTPPNVLPSSSARPDLDADTVKAAALDAPFTIGADDGSGKFRGSSVPGGGRALRRGAVARPGQRHRPPAGARRGAGDGRHPRRARRGRRGG